MDENTINKYLGLVPPEIRDAAAALHDDRHWAIYISLLENGETSFSEIKEEFDLESTQTIRILNRLIKGGLVAQYTDDLRESERRARSFYKVTEIGEDFIESLMERFLPGTPEINDNGVSGEIGQIQFNGNSSDSGRNLPNYNGTAAEPVMVNIASQPEKFEYHRYQ